MATTDTQMAAVFEAMCEAAAQRLQRAEGCSRALGHWPDRHPVFEALCAATAQEVQYFNAQNVAHTFWGMAKASARMAADFEAPCAAAAQLRRRCSPSTSSMLSTRSGAKTGSDHSGGAGGAVPQRTACCLQGSVHGSGAGGAVLHRAECSPHASRHGHAPSEKAQGFNALDIISALRAMAK